MQLAFVSAYIIMAFALSKSSMHQNAMLLWMPCLKKSMLVVHKRALMARKWIQKILRLGLQVTGHQVANSCWIRSLCTSKHSQIVVLENIHEVFTGIFDEQRLHVSIHNWGVQRGAKHNPKWAVCLKPHWDLNPWRYVEDIKEGFDPGYQGLVALTDQNLETGCHMTLPGFIRFAPQWCRERRLNDIMTSRRSHRAADDDPVLPYMQAIPLRKGEMVI